MIDEDLSDLRDKYGQPLADYEIEAIQRGGSTNAEIAGYALGFSLERLGLAEVQAVSCVRCGVLLAHVNRYMVRHRRECGWEGR